MLRRSSKRAFSSTRHTTCLPRSAASIRAGTSDGVVRGAVHGQLDREHVGVGHGLGARTAPRCRRTTGRGGARAGRWRASPRTCPPRRRSPSTNAGGCTGRPGRDRAARDGRRRRGSPTGRPGRAGRRRRRPAVSSTSSQVDQVLAQLGVHVGAHLEPHDLAEAAPAQLVLHGAQQVVGLVGDREVGVARHAEDARGAGSPCPGTARPRWRAITDSSGTKTSTRRSARSAAAPPSAPSRARTSR